MEQNKQLDPTLETPQVDVDKDAIIEKLNKQIVALKESNENLIKTVTKQRKALSNLVQDITLNMDMHKRTLEITQIILEQGV